MSLLVQLSPLHSNHREGAMPEKASAEMSTDLQKLSQVFQGGDLSAKGAGDSQALGAGLGEQC